MLVFSSEFSILNAMQSDMLFLLWAMHSSSVASKIYAHIYLAGLLPGSSTSPI